ncbi:vegetative cell wall protein gp1-like isoform X2 [Penaeus chinensis]|uniref:vegetative cell wall protein gp1-like isoform X2 n=1 Tax=Penaeus chinensis TaxID=139456 RepID=UPI001FB7681B|nr:vegetative cell wall protein gp1-like isoform X2 [Penaeus chinensis]
MEPACNLFCKCHVNDPPCYMCVILDCTIVRPMDDMVLQPSAPVLSGDLEFFSPSSLEERGPAKPPPSASSGESFVTFRLGEAKEEGVGNDAPGGEGGGGERRCLSPVTGRCPQTVPGITPFPARIKRVSRKRILASRPPLPLPSPPSSPPPLLPTHSPLPSPPHSPLPPRSHLPPPPHSPLPHSPPPFLPRPFLLPSYKREKNTSDAPHRERSSRNSRREMNSRENRNKVYKDQWDNLASRMTSIAKVSS